MEAPCLIIKIDKVCSTYVEEFDSTKIHTVICYCSQNKEKRVINKHDKPLLTLECPRRDLMRMIKVLDIDLKILAPSIAKAMINISSSNYNSYFLNTISKEVSSVMNGDWGCLILGTGFMHLCFCKDPIREPHGLIC